MSRLNLGDFCKDLISREAVIKAVDRHTREDGTLDDDISIILEEVKTGFDKEKVIEELEEYLFEKYCVEGDEKITEIVEKGGIE